ncbi:MAG: T9SS type A sorting domain-containing protein [Bacteroidia bacterium]|nr:T9SS type A sorting domain-containing protein [Bacteroidia bacterium]
MIKRYHSILLFFTMLFVSAINGQVLTIGNLTFTGSNFAGPANTSAIANAASRYAYIYPASTVSSLRHSDTIRSISFHRNGGGGLSGNCNMRIFMRMTVNSNYGIKSVNWVNLTSTTGMKKVYDKDPSADIDTINGWVRFEFSSPYVVDTVLGKNLEILVEYTQASAQMTNIFWTFESSGTVSGFTSNQTKFVRTNGGTLTDTTNSSSELHPTLRIEFPRANFDMSVNKVYSLGKLPVPQGNPDTVRAIVQNVGKKTATFKLFIESKGANNLIDSSTYTLNSLEEKTFALPLLYPINTGLDTLTVRMEPDEDNSNNTSLSYRIATEFMYSYKDPTRPITGGVGFNGSTGDFVAKFYSSSQKSINQIGVAISGSNQPFKLGIWAADGVNGTPKTMVWESDTLMPAPNFITPVDPIVSVNGNFYVGVRQIGTVNVGFGYQPDVPVRKNTFFYASPMGDTNWVDFAPDAPFKFVIEPRIQAANDVAPLRHDFPRDTLWLASIGKMAPKASFINYGTNDQTTPFSVKMDIKRFGNLEFSSSRTITLDSGERVSLTFDSTFNPLSAGIYDVTIITRLPNDQIKDNDTLKYTLVVAAFKDVGPGTIFDPSSGFDYEQFVDTIYPTVYVQNYGLDNQAFNVRAEIYDSSMNLIYSDVKNFNLTALNSVLASFTPFPCDVKGSYFFRAFSELGIDIDKTNDTVSRFFKIVRSNDVAISEIIYPLNGKSLSPPVVAKKPEALLINVGDANQGDVFPSYCDIYYGATLVYRDSFITNSFRNQAQTLLFKNFQPIAKGYYNMKVYCSLPTDQIRFNDTLNSYFSVGVPDDVELVAISPAPNDYLQINKKYPTSVTVRNNGYNPQNTPFPVVFKVTQGASLKYVKIINMTLDSGETKTVDIDTSLLLDNLQDYNVEAFTLLNVDFVKSNDTLKGIYHVAKSKDIGVTSILYPTNSDTLLVNIENVSPKIRIENLGDSFLSGTFRAQIRVTHGLNGVNIYTKFIDTQLIDSSYLLLNFPAFSINSAIPIKVSAWIEHPEDQYSLNDTARSVSQFLIQYDPRAINIDTPIANKTYLKKDIDIVPKVTISNFGLSTLPSAYARVIIMYIDTVTFLGNEVYRDSVEINNLPSGASVNVAMLKKLVVKDQLSGPYKCFVEVFSSSDQIMTNNVLQIDFRIDNSIGINSLKLERLNIYPNPSHEFITIDIKETNTAMITFKIIDILGNEIKCFDIDGVNKDIYIGDLTPGVYFLKSEFGLIKFVVE